MNKLIVDNTFIREVVDNYSDMIIRIAYQNLKNYSDAEDIAQEIFLKLINTDQEFNSYEHVKAWLIRVTINKCRDHKRSSWFKRTTSIAEGMDFAASDNKEEIMSQILELPVKYRNVIYLYYYEGYKIAEIANILSKSINTVNSQLQRARKQLKMIIIEEGELL